MSLDSPQALLAAQELIERGTLNAPSPKEGRGS
jgi:hypothetical protein